MKKLALSVVTIILTSCGPGELFEARTYGVRNSEWVHLSSSERHNAKQIYLQEEALAEQRRMNNLLAQQNAELIKQRQPKEPKSHSTDYRKTYHHDDYYAQNFNHSRTSTFDLQTRRDKERQVINEQQKILANIQQQNTLAQSTQEQNAIAEAKRRSLETYRQEQQRSAEQRALEEAKRRSLETYRQEQQRSSEQRAVEEAKRRSLETYRQEQAREHQLRNQEQRDLEQAIHNSMQTYNAETARNNSQAASENENWQANEGQIVRAGELVMNLQRELGRQPTPVEMQNKLQTSMGLNVAQSNKILDDLGLI